MKDRDWAGIKFKLLEERGECIDIIYIKDNINSQNEKVFLRRHDISDGLGGLIDILKQVDQLHFNKIPHFKFNAIPSLFKRIRFALKHLKRQKGIDYQWKAIDLKLKIKKVAPIIPSGVVYCSFNCSDSMMIEKYCKKNGFNLNSFLLWSLDHVSKKYLKEPIQMRNWMVPVNIRVEGQESHGNNVTTLSVFVDQESPEDIFIQIKSMMKSGIIFGGQIVANIPKYIGERGLRLLSRNIKSPYFGLCSNLGKWENQNDPDSLWFVAPPVTSFCPVASAILIWNSQINLTLNLHPSLILEFKESSQLMNEWYSTISKIVGLKNNSSSLIRKISWDTLIKKAEYF